MDIGLGLPATIPGVQPSLIVEWARKADEGPFSSLGALDRLVYPNFESMISLAAAAAVTSRVRLITTILIAPLRNAGIFAKQAASLDAISGGRLTLGLGVGGREDDFRAAAASFQDRGKRFDQQLALMKRVWVNDPVSDDIGPIGPPPVSSGGPELLIGGSSPRALDRVGKYGDGFIAGGGGPDMARGAYEKAEQSWEKYGRKGRPRFVVGAYYALGTGAAEKAASYIKHYYSFLGPMADQIAQSVPSSEGAVKGTIGAFDRVGVDELVLWPCIPEINQVSRLADLVS